MHHCMSILALPVSVFFAASALYPCQACTHNITISLYLPHSRFCPLILICWHVFAPHAPSAPLSIAVFICPGVGDHSFVTSVDWIRRLCMMYQLAALELYVFVHILSYFISSHTFAMCLSSLKGALRRHREITYWMDTCPSA
ncbi:hypothetical protein GY45DRAFT_84604 [Cubamyces sp. BRFM 1775]|nr:hypothetical protein GY45DRAFT_84604 [Cubamyces sp. BRFM 1775]